MKPIKTAASNGFFIIFIKMKNKLLQTFVPVFDAKKDVRVNNTIVSANSIILIGTAAFSPNASIDNGIPIYPQFGYEAFKEKSETSLFL